MPVEPLFLFLRGSPEFKAVRRGMNQSALFDFDTEHLVVSFRLDRDNVAAVTGAVRDDKHPVWWAATFQAEGEDSGPIV